MAMSLRSQKMCTSGMRASGMTFIEISVVLLIIGIIVSLIGPRLWRGLSGAQKQKTEILLSTLKTAIIQYHSDMGGQYPNTLLDLVSKPTTIKPGARWNGPYVDEKDTRDGFSNDFIYRKSTGGKKPYELYSWGPNGEGAPEDEWIKSE